MTKLDKLRDEMASTLVEAEFKNRLLFYNNETLRYRVAFDAGFNAALSVLLPEAKKIIDAVRKDAEWNDERDKFSPISRLAEKEIARWEKFIGEGENG